MVRRPFAGLVLAAGLALFACRASTVSVAFSPKVGQRYAYRYEITATVTRSVTGDQPRVVHLDTVLGARQQVQALTRQGARVRLELTRDGGTPRSAVVLVDRAGSLEGVSLVEGLDAAALGIEPDSTLGPTRLTAPPDRPLAPGDRWRFHDAARHGTGRLDRLGVIDGQDVAVVATSLTEDLAERGQAESSATRLTGSATTKASTSYDLHGGAIRRSSSHSHGRVQATIAPPAGSTAKPVHATITYDVTVRVTRTN